MIKNAKKLFTALDSSTIKGKYRTAAISQLQKNTELRPTDIVQATGIDRIRLYEALRELKAVNLVTSRREGKETHYKLNKAVFNKAIDFAHSL